MQVSWSGFNALTTENVRRLVPNGAGVYLLWVKLTDGSWRCFYVGQSADLEGRLFDHLSPAEPNQCIRRHVREHTVRFHVARVASQANRDGIEKFLYDHYRPKCNQVDPGGTPIPVNLPSTYAAV